MMDDIEKTKPVDEAPADDDETGAGCDVCMPPIALVGAEDYDYKYLCMPSMVRALRRNQLQRATRHRRDGLDGVGLTGLFAHRTALSGGLLGGYLLLELSYGAYNSTK